jgi:hypothetical protein
MYPRSWIAPSKSEAVEAPAPPQAASTREAIANRLANVKSFFIISSKRHKNIMAIY